MKSLQFQQDSLELRADLQPATAEQLPGPRILKDAPWTLYTFSQLPSHLRGCEIDNSFRKTSEPMGLVGRTLA
jgi:hypothetical protein